MPNYLLKWLYHFAFLLTVNKFLLFYILISIRYCQFFSHSNRCVWVSLYGFMILWFYNLWFPMTNDVEQLFMCSFAICVSSLVRCLFRSFSPCKIGLFLIVELESSSFILDTSLLYPKYNMFCKYFFPVYGLSFLFS